MRPAIKIEGLTESQNEELTKQIEVLFEDERQERARAIKTRTSTLVSDAPKNNQGAEGSTLLRQDGNIKFLYAKFKGSGWTRIPIQVETLGAVPAHYPESPYKLPIVSAAPGAGDGVPGRVFIQETGGNYYIAGKCSDGTWRKIQIA